MGRNWLSVVLHPDLLFTESRYEALGYAQKIANDIDGHLADPLYGVLVYVPSSYSIVLNDGVVPWAESEGQLIDALANLWRQGMLNWDTSQSCLYQISTKNH